MQTFRLIVFLVSAVVLPVLMARAAFAKMPPLVRLVLLAGLLLAARYLLGAVWVPDGIWALRAKAVVVGVSLVLGWDFVSAGLRARKAHAWAVFAFYILIPFVACFAFFSSSIAAGGLFAGDRAWWSLGFDSWIGNTAFWAFWVILSWLHTVEARASKLARVMVFFVSALAVALFASAGLRDRAKAAGADVLTAIREKAAGADVLAVIRENVAKRWPSINEQAAKIVAVWEKAVEKDREIVANGVVGKAKLKAATNIGHDIRKLRKDLLPLDSQAVLAVVNKVDKGIESSRKSLSALRERRLVEPGKAEDLDAKIAAEEARLASLESERAAAIDKVRADLKAIGLELSEGSVFLTVDMGEIVDNAIVAKNIGLVVENLKSLMDAEKGDAAAAKRYYGAYVVMLDVQSECFRQYLEKSKSGVWYDGVRALARDAEAAKAKNEAKAAADGATEFEKKAFLHSASTNEKTLKAAKAYIATLDKHSEIVKEKLAAAERMHEVALSFWESADIAGSFGARLSSDAAEFNALLELKLPNIAFYGDASVQEEFGAINQKLMKE